MNVTPCKNCGEPVYQNEYGNWKHEYLGLTFCNMLKTETFYNNWDLRCASPLEEETTMIDQAMNPHEAITRMTSEEYHDFMWRARHVAVGDDE